MNSRGNANSWRDVGVVEVGVLGEECVVVTSDEVGGVMTEAPPLA